MTAPRPSNDNDDDPFHDVDYCMGCTNCDNMHFLLALIEGLIYVRCAKCGADETMAIMP